MTANQKQQQRQRRDGVLLLLLAVFTVTQALYFNQQDSEQRDCLAQQIGDITSVQKVRAQLNERESEASKSALLAAGSLVTEKTLAPKEYETRRLELAKALEAYTGEVAAVKQAREENPVKAYPQGRCD